MTKYFMRWRKNWSAPEPALSECYSYDFGGHQATIHAALVLSSVLDLMLNYQAFLLQFEPCLKGELHAGIRLRR